MDFKNILKPLIITAPLLFSACHSEDLITPSPDEQDGVYLTLSCAEKGTLSRSTPGLDMPYVEYGRDEESTISDALIVIYTHPINSGSGKVKAVVKLTTAELGEAVRGLGSADNSYYDNSGTKQTTGTGAAFLTANKHTIYESPDLKRAIDGLTPGETYYAMAFANFGDNLNSQITVGMAENVMRDLVYTGPLFTDNSDYYSTQSESNLDLKELSSAWGNNTISEDGKTLTFDNTSSSDPSYPACQWVLSTGKYTYSQITVNLSENKNSNSWQVSVKYSDNTTNDSEWTTGTTATVTVDQTKQLKYIYIQAIVPGNSTVTLKPASATFKETGYGVHREYSHFAMSAINEVKFTVPEINASQASVNLGDFYVQRLAARVDVCFGVQAVSYNDYENATAKENNQITNMMLHYVHMKWAAYQVNYQSAWDGQYKYDMDVPSASTTGYPPGGLYRFAIYDENEYQRNLASSGASGLAEDHGEVDHRLPNDTWFWLENIEILDAVESGEYLLQRSNGTPIYMGHEGSWNNGYPTNFIFSPSSERSYESRDLCPEPSGSPTYGNAALADEERIKVRPVPYITSMLTGTDDAKFTIQQYHAAYDANPTAPYRDFDRKFHVSSVLGYVGENTYSSYNESNKYTKIRITGKTNMANAFSGTKSDYQTLSATITLRHSYGAANTGQPLCYGVVRNTIYKVFLRFFGEGENLAVRYWYYGGGTSLTEEPYPSTGTSAFTKYIVEFNGTQGAD